MNKIAIAGTIIVVIVAIVLGVYFGTKGKALEDSVIQKEVSPPNNPYVPNTDVSDLQKEIERLKVEAKEKEAKAADEIKAAADRADAAAKAAIESANAAAQASSSSSSSSSGSSSPAIVDYVKITELFSAGSSGTFTPEVAPELPPSDLPNVLGNFSSSTENNTANVNKTADSVDETKNIINEGKQILADNIKNDEERNKQISDNDQKNIANAKTLEERLKAERIADENAKKAQAEKAANDRIQSLFDTLTEKVNNLSKDTLAAGISSAESSLYIINLLYSMLKGNSEDIAGADGKGGIYHEFNNDILGYKAADSEIFNTVPNRINDYINAYENVTLKDALDSLKRYLNQKSSQVNSVLGRSNEELLKVPSKSTMDYYASEVIRIRNGGYNPGGKPPVNPAIEVRTNLDTYRKEGEGYLKEANEENTSRFNTLTKQLDNLKDSIKNELILLNGSVGPGPTDLTKVIDKTTMGTAISNSLSATNRLKNINIKLDEMKTLRDTIKNNVDSLKKAKKEYLDGAKITTAMLDKFITDSNGLVSACETVSTTVDNELKTYQSKSHTLQALSNQITSIFNKINEVENKKLFNTTNIVELNNIRTSIAKAVGNSGSITSYDDSRKIANIKNASLWGNYTFALRRNMGQI
jgi:hypothetical protein